MSAILRSRGRRPLVWWSTVGAVVLLPVVSGLLGGRNAVVGAVVGVGLVAVFLLGGRLPVRLADRVPAAAGFAVLVLNYAVRLALLLVVLAALRDASWMEPRAVGVTIVLGALVWSAVQVVGHVTSRRPTIEPTGSRR
jgi:ATP synthase protein I